MFPQQHQTTLVKLTDYFALFLPFHGEEQHWTVSHGDELASHTTEMSKHIWYVTLYLLKQNKPNPNA